MSNKTHLTERQHYHALYDFLKGHAHQWWTIGLELKFYPNELKLIQSNPMFLTQPNPTLAHFGEMLNQWLLRAPGDGRGSTDFATFEDLRAALLRVHGIAADALAGIEEVLESPVPSQPNRSPLIVGTQQPVDDPSNSNCLSEKHHLTICKYLHPMKDSQIILLGQALGLKRSNLKKMKDLPDDMVDGWLNREDHVLETSGLPTWVSLSNALKEIGQNGIAADIDLRQPPTVVITPKRENQQLTVAPSPPPPATTMKYVDKSPPNHSDSFKIMLSAANHWDNIGPLLKPPLPKGRMESIRKEQLGNNIGCIREMLSEWFRQIDPRPTWTALAEAVESFDPSKAKQIREKYCVQSHNN